MADDLTVDNGEGTDYDVATDDDGSGNHVQIVKLAQSADGSRTAISADSDGMLVNLGTNNDVVISDGGNTITVDGTVAVTNAGLTELAAAIDTEVQVDVVGALPAGTNNIGDVDIASIAAGDNNIGNVDVASSALPSGAATSAKQDTVIGHLDGVEGLLTTIDADTSNLSVVGGGTEAAAIRVTLANNSTGLVSVDDNGGALTVDNGGTFATQVDGAALTALQLIDDIVRTDDAAFAPGTDEVAMAGFFADESSTDSVDEGDGGAARMTLDRRQIVVNQPHSTGGCDTFHSNDLDETEEDVKTAAGTVYGYIITNRTTAAVYVHFYNATAANVTVGTTAPLFIFAVPGNATDYIAANMLGGVGINFSTAISVAATTDFPDDGSPAGPATNGVLCTVFYK